MTDDVYASLSRPFEETFTDVRGGVEITYVSGEQVTSRLNEVLGVDGWNFRVLQHDIHAEADEVWVLGELAADINGKTVTRQQFGSQKVKRSRNNGTPLDLGFDLKGASTDAMKKCASLLGVALYLSHKKPRTTAQRTQQSDRAPTPITRSEPVAVPLTCKQPKVVNGKSVLCERPLEAVPERNWQMHNLATASMKLPDKILRCWECFQIAERKAS